MTDSWGPRSVRKNSAGHLLIAEDEVLIQVHLQKVLQSDGWDSVELASDGREAIEKLTGKKYELCILDLRMPEANGLEVMREVRAQGIKTDFVIVTGYGTVEIAVQAMKLGAEDVLPKPIRPRKLRDVVNGIMLKHQSTSHITAERLDRYLAENYPNQDLRIADLCQHFGISARYVSLLFKQYIGCSFPRRLAGYRLGKAKTLLRESKLPLHAIATRCGFRNYKRLSEVFTRIEGESPRDYRKSFAAMDGAR